MELKEHVEHLSTLGPKGKKGVPWSFMTDVAELCTNVPKDERQTQPAMWAGYYGTMWPDDPRSPNNAQKQYHLVAQWALYTWDETNNQPGEKFAESVKKARYNSWANNGDYILDTMAEQSADGTTTNTAKKGDVNYRPRPDEPGYSGPYTKHVTDPS